MNVSMLAVDEIIQSAKLKLSEALTVVFNEDLEDITQPIPSNIYSIVDLTNLKPETTSKDIEALCEKAKSLQSQTVCVNSVHIPTAVKALKHSTIIPICVVGFPLGQSHINVLEKEIEQAQLVGACEIDMVFPAYLVKEEKYGDALDYLKRARACCKVPLKLILETSLHSKLDIAIISLLASLAGVDFVKTSTGMGSHGATEFDVALMRRAVGSKMGVKASGGIKTLEQAQSLVRAGASRLGASGLSVPKSTENSSSY